MSVAGLILAGGASTRMGRPKALLTWAGETFVERLVRRLAAAGCDPVRVVVGAHTSEIAGAVPAPARAIEASDWRRGMRASLRAGLRALPAERDVLLTHVDRPCVSSDTLVRLAASPGTWIPFHRGVAGHPVRLASDLCRRLLDDDDTPLHDLLTGGRLLVVDDPGVLQNVNTPEAYAALLAGAACAGGHDA